MNVPCVLGIAINRHARSKPRPQTPVPIKIIDALKSSAPFARPSSALSAHNYNNNSFLSRDAYPDSTNTQGFSNLIHPQVRSARPQTASLPNRYPKPQETNKQQTLLNLKLYCNNSAAIRNKYLVFNGGGKKCTADQLTLAAARSKDNSTIHNLSEWLNDHNLYSETYKIVQNISPSQSFVYQPTKQELPNNSAAPNIFHYNEPLKKKRKCVRSVSLTMRHQSENIKPLNTFYHNKQSSRCAKEIAQQRAFKVAHNLLPSKRVQEKRKRQIQATNQFMGHCLISKKEMTARAQSARPKLVSALKTLEPRLKPNSRDRYGLPKKGSERLQGWQETFGEYQAF